MLKSTQVELGNVIVAKNYRGEVVTRRLVGGTYGSVTKWFLIDADTSELKSRKRDTAEEVLEGFEILGISAVKVKEEGTLTKDISEVKVGDLFYVVIDGELTARELVGGYAYDTDIYFAIDPHTGKRCSRTRETVEEVLDGYEIEFALV